MIKTNCLECAVPLRGRVDKKFCCDSCRNVYNNRQNGNVNNYVRNVNNILRKNRRILDALFKMGDKQVHKGILVEMDFCFEYFTHKTISDDNVVYCIYDYEYATQEKSKYVVIGHGRVLPETARRKSNKKLQASQYNSL